MNESTEATQPMKKRRRSRRVKSGKRSRGRVSVMTTRLHVLHFNDVYNVEQPTDPTELGGAARFVTALESHGAGSDPRTLVLFSGDALNPSLISRATLGKHMPPLLNRMHVDCACIGNHEFDFGLDVLEECIQDSRFPWLNANVFDLSTDHLLADTQSFHILQVPATEEDETQLRVGVIGLVESEWGETLACMDASELRVEPFCEVGRRLAVELKRTHGCDLVIALTHMRMPNDRLLASEVAEIDLFLGGHDHIYAVERVPTMAGGKPVGERVLIKSGTDFRNFSHITLTLRKDQQQGFNLDDVNIEKIDVNSIFHPDAEVERLVNEYSEKLTMTMGVSIGRVDVDLDARFQSIRTGETNIGNLVCDVMLNGVEADVALLNSGTLRSDCIIEAGDFKLRDLCTLLPLFDTVVVLECEGRKLLEALENSVSQHPKLEGRFLQVSGIRFTFDNREPAGRRVVSDSVFVGDEALQLDRQYRVCMKQYLAQGRDGYTMFSDCPVLLDDENGPILSTLLQNHFRTISVLRGFQHRWPRHRQSIVAIAEKQRIMNAVEGRPEPTGSCSSLQRWQKARKAIVESMEQKNAAKVAPTVEGRIILKTE